jgi:signal transduction histidine kinase
MQQPAGQAAKVNGNELAAATLAEAGRVEGGFTPEDRVDGMERKRIESVVETLSNLSGVAESLDDVAHDARNMVTALGLYCDLLEEPGVLTTPFLHYAGELRLVVTASRRLVEKLLALELRQIDLRQETEPSSASGSAPIQTKVEPSCAGQAERVCCWNLMPAEPIGNLAEEVLANRNLLAALAGPSIALTVDAKGGALPVRMSGEDLTRILVNLVKNATEAMKAMPHGGRIQIGLHELPAATGTDRSSSSDRKAAHWLALTIIDNGPGISPKALEKIFESGYTTRIRDGSHQGDWSDSHHGLGLAITRSIIEAAGGSIHATNHSPTGACFEIELPVRSFREAKVKDQ